MRGSVCGWYNVCLGGKGKHTDIRGQVHESPRINLRCLTQVRSKISK